MKNAAIIILATIMGFIGGGFTTYFILKDQNQTGSNHSINVVATPQNKPSAFNENATDPAKSPLNNETISSIKFKENTYDFGDIEEGTIVHTAFEFVNDSKRNLVINNCLGSCGCTIPKWPKETIKPGEKGIIEVQFNTAGKKGKQMKTVTVYANTEPATTILYVKSNVYTK
ncbi:MAG: DUF1573 domain-containing protein [Bacteroidota bacterium]